MNKYTVMPLLNSSFEPGKAREIVAGFEDMDVRNIAQAELFYFMGEAESSSEIAERYLTSEIMELRLSASMIYGYSNMTLGNLVAVQRGLEEIQECLKLAMRKKGFRGNTGCMCFCEICRSSSSSSSNGWNSFTVEIQQ